MRLFRKEMMKTEKIRPLHDRVLAKRLDPEGKTKGGIIIPESAKRKSRRAVVVAVGPGKILEEKSVSISAEGEQIIGIGRLPMSVKKGDIILINLYAGNEIDDESGLNPEGLVIVSDAEILAVIDS